ncbi:MAG TPA: alginate lyase family protein [Vicinamibacterales bacterium]
MPTLVPRRVPGPVELLYRARQEAGKLVERAWGTAAAIGIGEDVALRPSSGVRANPFAGRFFEGAMDPAIPGMVRAACPDAASDTIARADRLMAGHFDLLGYQGLSFGEPIDWHLDPVNGRRAPRTHWATIDPLDAEVVGDSKVTWELSRHQWLVTLAQAYRLTGDDRYARRAVWAFRAWVADNPPGIGLNWGSSLEAAFRLIAWCWTLALLRDAPAMTSRLQQEITTAAARQAEHVSRYLSYYFSPNTHLTGEALGLFYAGVLLPTPRARRWRELGRRILIDQSERQIRQDGIYFEHATCYQRYTAEIYLHFLLLATRNTIPVPAPVTARVERLLDSLLALCRPDGGMPQIGDADGGWLLPLAVRRQDDCRGVFAVAAAMFDRPEYTWMAGGPAAEALWLVGHGALHERKQRPPAGQPSRLFTSGYAVLRDSWERDAHQLVMDVGPLGCHVSGGHGHADLLAIQVSPFGEPCIVDPGTGCYTRDLRWRHHFRSTAAHSTVVVDGAEYARPAGPFSWEGTRPAVLLRHWHATPRWDHVDAQHDAWSGDGGRLVHRRRVFFRKEQRYWIVVDDLLGAGAHQVDVRFQFASTVTLCPSGLSVRARTPGGGGLWVVPVTQVGLALRLTCGADDPLEGWYSRDYGCWEPAPALVFSTGRVPAPIRVMTVLAPARGDTPPPVVSPVSDASDAITGLYFPDSGERVVFDDVAHVSVVVRGTPLRPKH